MAKPKLKTINVAIGPEYHTLLGKLRLDLGSTYRAVIELALATLDTERNQVPGSQPAPELAVGVTHIVPMPVVDEVIDPPTEFDRVMKDVQWVERTTADDPHDADPDDGDPELPGGAEGASTSNGEGVQRSAGAPGETLVADPQDDCTPSAPADPLENGIAANPFEPTPKGEDDAWLEDLLGQV